MNKALILCTGCAMFAAADALACTSLIATPGATTDGSTLATYAADSHTLYGELYHSPAADWPEGSVRVIKEWDTGKHLGEIPQVPHTYATMGNMNEHGLTIAESTFGGREELADPESLIDYGSLIYITLERAKDAREAITVMTDLVNRYGFCSEGESFTIADPNEAWVMEMVGKGKGGKGALWVARKVPDGYIAGHANQSRIHQFPLNDPETLYAPDVISFAREKGWFDGKDEEFSFSATYCPADFGTLRGCDARVWAYYNKFAEDMDRYLPWINNEKGAEVMPLWVKPSRKLSLTDMKWMMRDHFEGTPFDMTKDVGAGPFTVPYRARPMEWEVDSVKYLHERAIATQQTGFSFVSQMNREFPQAMRGILWFGCDDANTCVYVPIYSCMTSVPRAFEQGNGDMYNISWDAAFWVNNWVANQAYYRYSQMIPDIRKVQSDIETRLEEDADSLRIKVAPMDYAEASALLNDHLQTASADYVKRYKALGDYLLVKYLDFNIKKERDGQFARTADGMPEQPKFAGYDDPRYFRAIVDETGDHLRLK
ncbi:MAG: C69 family dipeptidase [Candidatus Amulumruptor caecigallinarius]|nr:C69 family dipeptidase [Candidatus Amulumruptor caecigallinarius]MCM1396199.1 C69 family dipeptidase [Candidatus Amulumruptor caecigallinarius]MCM1453801.1 C69 family dipeptidase [bacterium]